MSHFLFQFAIVSTTDIYGYLTLIACFVAFVIFLLRLNNENLLINRSTVKKVEHSVETPVVKFENPFFVDISSESSLKDGASLHVSLLKQTNIWSYWGVSVKAFYDEMQKPLSELRVSLQSGNFLKDISLASVSRKSFRPCKTLGVKYIPPDDITPEELGTSPRDLYPLVLVFLIDESDISSASPHIVMMFTIIHLKDALCTHSSHIVAQYVKSSDDRICYLQPLFVPSPEEGCTTDVTARDCDEGSLQGSVNSNNVETGFGDDTQGVFDTANKREGESIGDKKSDPANFSDSGRVHEADVENLVFSNRHCEAQESCDDNHIQEISDSVESEDRFLNDCIEDATLGECIICQTEKANVAFLPCRHACVCGKCLKKLDKCPMCRGHFISYFRLGYKGGFMNSESDDQETAEPNGPEEGDNWWQNLNNRINYYLGFT